LSICFPVAAQTSVAPLVTFTAEQDKQNMMDQLGIQALRPGPSGDEKTPNHANIDEARRILIPMCRRGVTAVDRENIDFTPVITRVAGVNDLRGALHCFKQTAQWNPTMDAARHPSTQARVILTP
jgi:hypothetical protein